MDIKKENKVLAEEKILQINKQEIIDKKNEKHKRINIIVSNIIRIILAIFLLKSFVIKSYNETFIITLALVLTYFPSLLERKFGVYLPASLQIVITLFIFATQYLR